MLAMFDAKAHLRPCRAVGPELVRDHDAGRDDRRFQKPFHEPLRSATVSSTLDQDVENETVLINGAPEPVWLAGDRDDDLIHMPFVAASRRALADLVISERIAHAPRLTQPRTAREFALTPLQNLATGFRQPAPILTSHFDCAIK